MLRVCRYGLAVGDALWFIATQRQSANVIVIFCSEGFAQLKVCFVPTRGDADRNVLKHTQMHSTHQSPETHTF